MTDRPSVTDLYRLLYNNSTNSSLKCQLDINYSETQIVSYCMVFQQPTESQNEGQKRSPPFEIWLYFCYLSPSSNPESDGLLITTHRSFFSSKLHFGAVV